MISYHDALQIIGKAAANRNLEVETIGLESASGRVCARNLLSPLDLQPFDNSAMDGFAIKTDDLRNASPERPVSLKKSGVISAGQDVKGTVLSAGCCWHVMTGAALPEGAEAIVPVEDVCEEGEIILFGRPARAGQHIRYAGEDFKKGASVLSMGERINSARMMALAGLGIPKVDVFKKPKILFISTGAELVDDLSRQLQGSQIYNSNKVYAQTLLSSCGAEVHVCDTIPDDADLFLNIMTSASEENFDLVVSSGAVSAGVHDFVKGCLESFGAKILYHKLKLKPGKPNLLASLPSGTLYFGLPGNPVSTAVGLRFFVLEAMRVMQKTKMEKPLFARAKNRFSKKAGLHMILKGKVEHNEDGLASADILNGQGSFMISPFLEMNGWVFLTEDQEKLESNEIVEFYPLIPV